MAGMAGRVLYVDANNAGGDRDGLTPQTAFTRIQDAVNVVQPGDTIEISPGIYFERIVFRKLPGTAENPVVLRAALPEKNSVIISGADPDIRMGRVEWELVDEEARLFRVPYAGESPSRVLYSGIDLYPYGSLQGLLTFTTEWQGGSPGPRHGYYYDSKEKMLYVRLHASGRYGSDDPRDHAMAVSTSQGKGRGMAISLQVPGDAHLRIEGITFETPGDSAVLTESSHVTISHCWFLGCPYGVRGNKRSLNQEKSADHIVIEYCEYTEGSSFWDAVELLEAFKESGRTERPPWHTIWHRKTAGRYGMPSGKKNYENGIAVRIGNHWTIRHNHIHDVFEGIANDGASLSVGLRVHDNVFERICDNGIETENHAKDVYIYRNAFIDVFEPFSWQPHGGPPWPGPLYFYENIIVNTPEMAELWNPSPHGARAVFKIGISLKNWRSGRLSHVPKSPLAAPEPGLFFFNNTILFPGGRLFNLMGSRDVPIENVYFFNNIILTDYLLSTAKETDLRAGHFEFDTNFVYFRLGGTEGAVEMIAGENGIVAESETSLGLTATFPDGLHLLPNSPAVGAALDLSDMDLPTLPDLGALPLNGDGEWLQALDAMRRAE